MAHKSSSPTSSPILKHAKHTVCGGIQEMGPPNSMALFSGTVDLRKPRLALVGHDVGCARRGAVGCVPCAVTNAEQKFEVLHAEVCKGGGGTTELPRERGASRARFLDPV